MLHRILLSCLLLAAPLAMADVIAPFSATYKANYNGMELTATHRLEQKDGSWYFETIAQGFIGSITETSTFTLDKENRITNRHYLYKRELIGNTRNQETLFNWEEKKAHSTGKKTGTVPLAGGELDKVSHLLQLRQDLRQGNDKPCYNIVDKDKVKNYCFEKRGEEIVETAIGPIHTVRMERVRAGQERATVYWFATELDFLLVKLQHSEKKDDGNYTLLLQSTSLLDKSPAKR